MQGSPMRTMVREVWDEFGVWGSIGLLLYALALVGLMLSLALVGGALTLGLAFVV